MPPEGPCAGLCPAALFTYQLGPVTSPGSEALNSTLQGWLSWQLIQAGSGEEIDSFSAWAPRSVGLCPGAC